MDKSFQKLVEIAAANYNFSKTFKAIQVCQEYRCIIKEIFSEESLQKTFPLFYKNNILTIGAVNSGWSQKIIMHQHIILQRINQKFGERMVTKLRIRLQKNLDNNTYTP